MWFSCKPLRFSKSVTGVVSSSGTPPLHHHNTFLGRFISLQKTLACLVQQIFNMNMQHAPTATGVSVNASPEQPWVPGSGSLSEPGSGFSNDHASSSIAVELSVLTGHMSATSPVTRRSSAHSLHLGCFLSPFMRQSVFLAFQLLCVSSMQRWLCHKCLVFVRFLIWLSHQKWLWKSTYFV